MHLKWPTFNPLTQVIVEENIQAHLLDSHKEKYSMNWASDVVNQDIVAGLFTGMASFYIH